MITLFASDQAEQYVRNLYCLTCKHVAPEKDMPVFVYKGRECQPEEIGLSVYPFGIEKQSINGGFVDITCVKIYDRCVPLCNMNIMGCKWKLSDVLHFSGTLEDNKEKLVFKWDSQNESETQGKYDGAAYLTPVAIQAMSEIASSNPTAAIEAAHEPRRVDLIRSEEHFGKPGESGALICIQDNRQHESDIISPAFVYLGKFDLSPNLYMCFRLHEGIECLHFEHKIQLSLCTNNGNKTPSTRISSERKRKLSGSS